MLIRMILPTGVRCLGIRRRNALHLYTGSVKPSRRKRRNEYCTCQLARQPLHKALGQLCAHDWRSAQIICTSRCLQHAPRRTFDYSSHIGLSQRIKTLLALIQAWSSSDNVASDAVQLFEAQTMRTLCTNTVYTWMFVGDVPS